DERERMLRDLRHGLDRFPADRDVGEDWWRGWLPVPDVVVDELKVPHPRAGLRIEAHEAVAEQVVPQAMAAVEVAGGHLDRDVDVAELFVRGQRRPRTGVAGVLPGIAFPGFVAGLARPGN